MIHGELIELGETKLVVQKLKEQIRVISLLVKKEQAKQESINQDIMETSKLIQEFNQKIAYNSIVLEAGSIPEPRAKTNHTTTRRTTFKDFSRRRSDA